VAWGEQFKKGQDINPEDETRRDETARTRERERKTWRAKPRPNQGHGSMRWSCSCVPHALMHTQCSLSVSICGPSAKSVRPPLLFSWHLKLGLFGLITMIQYTLWARWMELCTREHTHLAELGLAPWGPWRQLPVRDGGLLLIGRQKGRKEKREKKKKEEKATPSTAALACASLTPGRTPTILPARPGILLRC
jgi:hypothetical protein